MQHIGRGAYDELMDAVDWIIYGFFAFLAGGFVLSWNLLMLKLLGEEDETEELWRKLTAGNEP